MHSLTPCSMAVRGMIDDVVQSGNSNSLSDTLRGQLQVITGQYMSTITSADKIENEIYDLWYMLIQAAKNITTHLHLQDTIIRYLLATQALGRLQRPEPGPIIFSDGNPLWSGLPLLAPCLINEFTERFYTKTYTGEQRENLGGFLGRLLCASIYNGPALCALSLFRETLEASRPLVETTSSEGISEAQVPLEDLTRALTEFTQNFGYSIVLLCSKQPAATTADTTNYADYPHLSDLGELALQASTATMLPTSQYSPQRWAFWIQRLKELSRCGVESVEGNARGCLAMMVDTGNQLGLQ